MGRLRSPQRNLEVSLMKFCLLKLGGWSYCCFVCAPPASLRMLCLLGLPACLQLCVHP